MLNALLLDAYVDDIGGTNSTTFASTAKRRAYDRWSNNIIAEIMMAMADFDFQAEISTHDLVANQREYILPVDFLTVKRVDAMLDGVNWHRVSELDAAQLGDSYAQESDITQKFTNDAPFFDMLDSSIMIYSGTIAGVTGGLKLTYSKEVVGQNASGQDIQNIVADTDVSNLPEFAQMALVYGALIDFFTDRTDNLMLQKFNLKLYGNAAGRPADQQKIGGLLKQILNYYTSKDPDKQMSIAQAYSDEDFK